MKEKPKTAGEKNWTGYLALSILIAVIAALGFQLDQPPSAAGIQQAPLGGLLIILLAVVITVLFWVHSKSVDSALRGDLQDIEGAYSQAMQDLTVCDHQLGLIQELTIELATAISAREAVEIANQYIDNLNPLAAKVFIIYDPRTKQFQQLVYITQEIDSRQLNTALEKGRELLADQGSRTIQEAATKMRFSPRVIEGKLSDTDPPGRSLAVLPIGSGQQLIGAAVFFSDEEGQLELPIILEQLKLKLSILAMAIQRAQSFLVDQRSRTKAVVENSSNGVLIFEEDGETVTLSNVALSEMTGLTKGQFTVTDFCTVFQDTADLRSSISAVLKDGRRLRLPNISLRDRDFDILLTPIFDFHEDIVGGAIIMNDITHFIEIDRMKSEFVSIASHQLRTPLTTINWYVEMLLSGDLGPLDKQQHDYLEEVHDGSLRMVSLVNDLLNVSRLESGRLKVDPQLIDLADLIRSIIKETGPLAEPKGIALKFDEPSPPLPKILLDKTLVRQVVHNLITNAIRYTPKQAKSAVEVRLYTKQEGADKSVVISVRDHGIGIPEDQKDNIFEKFFRADNAVQAVSSGSGLGLYMAKMVMDASGGKISFQSKQDEGTTFLVEIPISGMVSKDGDKGLMP